MLRAPAAMIQEGSRVPGCRVGDGGSDLMMMTVVTIKYIVIYIYKYTHVHTYILAKLVKNLSKISGNPANTIIKNFILIALSF